MIYWSKKNTANEVEYEYPHSNNLKPAVRVGGGGVPLCRTHAGGCPPRVDCLAVPVLLIPRQTVWREAGSGPNCRRDGAALLQQPGLQHTWAGGRQPWGASGAWQS